MINLFSPTMGLLNDNQIIKTFGEPGSAGEISPFFPTLQKDGLSFGLSSFGYDIRLSPGEFYVFPHPVFPEQHLVIDPKKLTKTDMVKVSLQKDETGEYFIIPPNTYGLGFALEFIRMPDDVLAICMGKSTNARCGCIVNITPIEPGWYGWLTVELTNSAPYPLKVYANEGIAQLLFIRGKEPETVYAHRKYQGQLQQVTTPIVL